MKVIARLVFKVHRFIYKYPTKSEIRLALAAIPFDRFELTESVGILYLCESSIEEVGDWFGMDEKAVIKELNTLADKVKL
jgi:hypothetical protein